jgi:hypothetical protein
MGAAPDEVVVEHHVVKGITLRAPFVVLQPASVLGRLRRRAVDVVSVLVTWRLRASDKHRARLPGRAALSD